MSTTVLLLAALAGDAAALGNAVDTAPIHCHSCEEWNAKRQPFRLYGNSFYVGTGSRHPWEGVTEPIDPEQGAKQGKYTWAKSPRYDVPGRGYVPLEVGPLARQMVAGRPDAGA